VTIAAPLRRRALLAAALSLAAGAALAHHGWRWTAAGDFELTGLIETARLGNPHGVLTVNADGEIWTVEVGQPWRNANAGLTDEMLAPGVEVTVIGRRSADPAQLVVKAITVVIGGREHALYPNGV
jgi:hypothetical protein